MKSPIKIYARPKLKSPVMLASWPGIGDVSLIVATYLRKKLDFKELGEIEPSYFFDAIGVVARDNIVEAPQFPQSRFYYWKNPGEGSDIILFIGEDQPITKGYELANCVLDVGGKVPGQADIHLRRRPEPHPPHRATPGMGRRHQPAHGGRAG